MQVGQQVYHIDEPNQPYEVVRTDDTNGYVYIVLFHPSFVDAKHCKFSSLGKTMFETRAECIDARIERARKNLELEERCKERKI